MCFWAEKNKSLAGIKPAGGDNNNMERKHSPPNYDTVDDQYHGRYCATWNLSSVQYLVMSLNDSSFGLSAQVIELLISTQFRQMLKWLFHACNRTLSIKRYTDWPYAWMVCLIVALASAEHAYWYSHGESNGAFVFRQIACIYSLWTTKLDLLYNKKIEYIKPDWGTVLNYLSKLKHTMVATWAYLNQRNLVLVSQYKNVSRSINWPEKKFDSYNWFTWVITHFYSKYR